MAIQYGWMRQWARDTLADAGVEVPELAQVMEEAQSGDNWYQRLVSAAKEVLPKAVSTAQAALAQLSYSGTTGNFLSTEDNIVLTGKFFKTVEQFPEKIGSPLHKAVMINTLNGFCQCRNAVFSSTTATVEEEIAIEAFMNDGFYYE